MIRIVEEDILLGTSKVTVMSSQPAEVDAPDKSVESEILVEQNGAILKAGAGDEAVIEPAVVEESDSEEIFEACMEDTSLAEEDVVPKDEVLSQAVFKHQVYDDYIQSLNEQIDFLKSQLNEKNKQLNSKDELILNFQYLLKEEHNRILLLEQKLDAERVPFWKRFFGGVIFSSNE